MSEIFSSAANAVITYINKNFNLAEILKTWLRREPARLAFQKSLARTYAAFARQYPEYTASLFDEFFLIKQAVPELSKLLIQDQHPDPVLLALKDSGIAPAADVWFVGDTGVDLGVAEATGCTAILYGDHDFGDDASTYDGYAYHAHARTHAELKALIAANS